MDHLHRSHRSEIYKPSFTSSLRPSHHTTHTHTHTQPCTHVQGGAHTHQPHSQEALKEEEARLGIFMHVYI